MVKAIVGANWGDEGKGKITDMMAQEADIVVRFQGGANAGHTIVNKYGKFALHALPSGVFSSHITNIIGNGVALNIPLLFQEVQSVIDRNVPAPKLLVSDRAQIVMPYHILFDQYEEERLGGKSFGSTKSGIAPFYSDKYAKIGFQVSELFDQERLAEKVERVCETKNILLEHLYHKPLIDPKELLAELKEYRDMVAPYVCDVSSFLDRALKEGKTVLLEGQLGTLKDPDHGIYPMVTSSSTLAAFGAIGAGLPPYEIRQIVTVCKAYSSAVGAGAFVSELFGEEAEELRRRGGDGGEYKAEFDAAQGGLVGKEAGDGALPGLVGAPVGEVLVVLRTEEIDQRPLGEIQLLHPDSAIGLEGEDDNHHHGDHVDDEEHIGVDMGQDVGGRVRNLLLLEFGFGFGNREVVALALIGGEDGQQHDGEQGQNYAQKSRPGLGECLVRSG